LSPTCTLLLGNVLQFWAAKFLFDKVVFDEETRLKDDATVFLCQRMLHRFPHALHVLALKRLVFYYLFIFIAHQDTNYYELE
jgi:hypothetical protein